MKHITLKTAGLFLVLLCAAGNSNAAMDDEHQALHQPVHVQNLVDDLPVPGTQVQQNEHHEPNVADEGDASAVAVVNQEAVVELHAPAQFLYALMLLNGQGGELNLDEARKYYKLAADQGYTPSPSMDIERSSSHPE